jgi:hypothetical protein
VRKAEEPAWLVAAVDQRVALMKDHIPPAAFGGYDVVETMLTEPPEGASKETFRRWDESCDHCGTYLPGGLYFGVSKRDIGGHTVSITFAACARCLNLNKGEE